MKKENLLLILMPILIAFMSILGYLKLINGINDPIKFKSKYESLNNKYYKVKISKDNSIKYSSYNEIFDVIKSKTGIIYLGYPECNDCRFAIETLLNVVSDNKIKTTIYYLDIHNDRDSYTIENEKLVYEKDENNNEIKGTENYFKLLKVLDENIFEYILYIDDKEYDTKEKRIHFPSIIFVKNGKILGLEYASTDIKYKDLYNIYQDYISDMYSSTCDNLKEEAC